MDRYKAEMIARGPTLADDGDTPTGSVHIVDLPDPAAARAFAFGEPELVALSCDWLELGVVAVLRAACP
jgi:uncharacterized protein YciI